MHKHRLLQLADYLEAGKFKHKQFSFATFDDGPLTENGCGTLGCAVGELPGCFPQHWKYRKIEHSLWGNWYIPLPIEKIDQEFENPDEVQDEEAVEYVMDFFDINRKLYMHLFWPEAQNIELFGGIDCLEQNSTAQEVAENIRLTVSYLERSR
jgi:hypothetical protein